MRILVCTAAHPGTRTQAKGVGLGFAAAWQARRPHALPHEPMQFELYRWWHPLAGRLGLYRPDLIISCGTSGERRARRQRAFSDRTVWCQVEAAGPGMPRPDLNVVPRHDWRPEFDGQPDMMAVVGVPHEVAPASPEQRSAARRTLGLGLTTAVVAVMIGGPNPAFLYDAATTNAIADLVGRLVREGCAVLVTGSRRTPKALMDRLATLASPGLVIWNGKGANPYRQFLVAADQFFVTEDSISMTCEAVATGRPVRAIRLTPVSGRRLEKFRRFQQDLAPWVRDVGMGPLFSAGGEAPPPAPEPAAEAGRRLVTIVAQRRSDTACADAGGG